MVPCAIFLHSSGQSPGELLARALAVRRSARPSALSPVQGRAFVHRDVVGLVALDFILRFIRARMMGIALVIHVAGMHTDDRSADVPGLGVPSDVITDPESPVHGVWGTVKMRLAGAAKTAMNVTGSVALALADTWWTALGAS